jgi:hypothetical protein
MKIQTQTPDTKDHIIKLENNINRILHQRLRIYAVRNADHETELEKLTEIEKGVVRVNS